MHVGRRRCPGWVIYLGCETRDALVEENPAYDCLESLHVWYKDWDVGITNNVFVGSEQYQLNSGNSEHVAHEGIRLPAHVVYCTSMKGRLFTVFGKRSLPADHLGGSAVSGHRARRLRLAAGLTRLTARLF